MLPNFFSSNNLKIFRSARTLKFFRVTWSVTNLAFRNKNQGHRLTRRFRIWSLGWFGPVGQFRLHEFLLPFMAKDKNNLVITVQFCFINIQILKITTLCQPKCACCKVEKILKGSLDLILSHSRSREHLNLLLFWWKNIEVK